MKLEGGYVIFGRFIRSRGVIAEVDLVGLDRDGGTADGFCIGAAHADAQVRAIGPVVSVEGILGCGGEAIRTEHLLEKRTARSFDEMITEARGGEEQRLI